MFKDLAKRAEKLMNRAGSAHTLHALNKEDLFEARSLMGSLVDYVERQSCYPTRFNEENPADEDLFKMNHYYAWYERLENVSHKMAA